MTERQIEILKKSIDGVHFYDDLQGHDRGVLMYLEQEKLVYTMALDPPIYYITEKGRVQLKRIEDEANQQAEQICQRAAYQKAEHKAQRVNTLLGALFGSAFTLFVEHFNEIIAFIRNIF